MLESKEALIEGIVDLEEAMFVAVVPETPAPCQQDTTTFRIMRRAQFSAWPQDALESYHGDLCEARKNGKNLMTLKYARMDDRIPPINTGPLIDKIVTIQVEWQYRLFQKYPALIARGRSVEKAVMGVSFKRYLAGELETYSSRTLACLSRYVKAVYRDGGNMSEQVYLSMVMGLGYASLEEAEQAAKNNP